MTTRPPSARGSSAGASAAPPPRRSTLPPPEWVGYDGPRSVASLALEHWDADRPLARRSGARAELAHLRARLRREAEAADSEAERQTAAQLARALAARGAALAPAPRLARRSLVLADDPALREELAGWFAGLGELHLAAAALRSSVDALPPERAARILTRIAVHLGRSGDPAGVLDALQRAAELDPQNPVPLELCGAVASWAPRSVSAERAAQAYLEGAERREALGEGSAAFEDLLRAHEIAPTHAKAAERLAATLAQRGRRGAADEVLREHAAASAPHARPVHLWRMADAVARGELARAFGAALDAELDAELDPYSALRALGLEPVEPEGSLGFDELVERLGLFELLAARLELTAEQATGSLRGRCLIGLARLYEGPLASPERAVEAWVDALAASPGSPEALERLREQAASVRDQTVLVEAVLRVGGAPVETWEAERSACLTELTTLAELRLADPAIALWGLARLAAAGVKTPELAEVSARAAARAPAHAEMLAQLEEALARTGDPERPTVLRRAAALLRGRPERLPTYLAVLEELVVLAPTERVWQTMLERALLRAGDDERLERALLRCLERRPPVAERQRLTLALAAVDRRRQDLDGAHARVARLLAEGGAVGVVGGLARLLAARRGAPRGRAEALVARGSRLGPGLRAVALAVAADLRLAAGDREGARTAAEQAHHLDPAYARPIATLARVAVGSQAPDRVIALERAMGVLIPRADYCEALAQALSAAGDRELALAWTQRWLALRPGDPRAAAALLELATNLADVPRLVDALGWLFAQPQPLAELTEPISAALVALARLDPSRTGALARRALDVLGPRDPLLRRTVLEVADLVGEPGLALAAIERWLAAGQPGEARAETLLELYRRRRAVGDADGAARCLVRALDEGADPAAVLREVDAALPPRTSDGEISLLEARAEALSALSGVDLLGAAQAWRELGAALWDLAGDPHGAVRAWQRALVLDPESGIERFARDLGTFGGHDVAVTRLVELASTRGEPRVAARVYGVAGAAALAGGRPDDALDLALRALELDPGQAEALAVAERAASPERLGDLERAYGLVVAATLGRYGERAAHYRAARQFERRGAADRAFTHALAAFEAVPTQGVTFVLLARLAERTGQHAEMLRAIERAAGASLDDGARAEWMRRAASFAGRDPEGRRQRVDVLLRALALRPDVTSVRHLVAAVAEAIAGDADEREIMAVRFARALRALIPGLAGPDGARVALELATGALAVFGDAALADEAIARALECDAAVDEYAALVPHGATRAADPGLGAALVGRVEALGADPWSNLGRAAAELAVCVAQHRGDAAAVARLLLGMAGREPDDAELGARATAAVRAVGDPALAASLSESLPVAQRVPALLELARAAEARDDPAGAVDALERALTAPALSEEQRATLIDRLADVLTASGRREALFGLLAAEVERPGLAPARQLALSRRHAAALAASGRGAEGLELLVELRARYPHDRELLGDAVVLARQAGDRRAAADALDRLVDLASEPAERAALLRELGSLRDELGDPRAEERWAHLLECAPADLDALAALERAAERRGDFEGLIGLLARRAELAVGVDEIRRVRLRRAMILEQRLARHDEARAELEELLASTGDHLSVLRVLADLHHRLGDELRAAPLWLRASAVAPDGEEAAGLAQRACEAFLRGNDVAEARRVLDSMRDWAPRPLVAALRVEVERRGERPLDLARALAEHAELSQDAVEKRAAHLVEAARLAEAAGEGAEALAHARRAAALAPSLAAPQLIARLLEYRQRGAGTSDEARVTVAELRAIETPLAPPQVELRSFLVAEALDVVVGAAAGMRELERACEEVGERPLIAVGLAERAVSAGDAAAALPRFETALAGDLRGLRARGEVALAAALAARRAGELERALGFVEIALVEDRTRARALELRAVLEEELHPPAPAAPPPAPAAPAAGTDSRAPPAEPAAPEPDEVVTALVPPRPERPDAVTLPVPPRAKAAGAPPLAPVAPQITRPAEDLTPRDATPPSWTEEPFPLTRRSDAPAAAIPRAAPAPLVPVPAAPQLAPTVAAPRSLSRPRVPVAGPPPETRVEFSRPSPIPQPSPASPAPPAPEPSVAPRTPPTPPRTPPAPPSPPTPLVRTSVPPPPPDAAPLRPRQVAPEPLVAPRAPEASPGPGPGERDAGPPPLARTLLSAESPVAPAAGGRVIEPLVVQPGAARAAERAATSTPPDAALFTPMPPGAGAEEAALVRELDAGSIAAGLTLLRRWEGRRDRSRERVAACRKLVLLAPADEGLLERLAEAARADANPVYAAAIDHVRHALRDEPDPPPPLLAQPEQPERVRLMLFRERGAVQEALALVWEGASHVFKREPAAYGVTGVERVPFWSPSPVARVYGAAARTLGISPPLFQRRVGGDITLSIALLQTPSVIVTGELPRPSPEFAFHLGVMLAAAMPGHALLCGAPEDQVRGVLRALAMAFGPPSASRSGLTAVANLAEVLWESIPSRSQRRLRQLCDDPQRLAYESAMAEVRAATRRAGLFVAGDLRVAIREVALELELPPGRGLGEAIESCPELLDLFRLATSPEYAEARWQPARLTSRAPEGTWLV